MELKQAAAKQCGIKTVDRRLSATATEAEVLTAVAALDDDPLVDGILVQLPLPPHLSAATILAAVSAGKDGNCLP